MRIAYSVHLRMDPKDRARTAFPSRLDGPSTRFEAAAEIGQEKKIKIKQKKERKKIPEREFESRISSSVERRLNHWAIRATVLPDDEMMFKVI